MSGEIVTHNDRYNYLARKTMYQMLISRGYDNNQMLLDTIAIPFTDVKSDIDLSKINLELINKDGNKYAIISFMVTETKSGKDDLQNYYNLGVKLNDEKKLPVNIIVIRNKISPALEKYRNELNAINGKQVFVELWTLDQLQYNISESEYVPRHIILTKEESNNILEEMQINESDLPRIKQTDPVIKYLGGRSGQMVKIIRESETTGETFYYRLIN